MFPDQFRSITKKEKDFEIWLCPHCDCETILTNPTNLGVTNLPPDVENVSSLSDELSKALAEDLEIEGSSIGNPLHI